MKYVRNTHKTPLKIASILFNRCETKKEIDLFLQNHNLQETCELVCDNFIPEDEAVKKAIDQKLPLALYDIKSPASSAYLSFAKQMELVFK